MTRGARWRPVASLSALRQRAEMLTAVRGFFAAEGVLEVETPILSSAAVTDLHLESFGVADGPRRLFLHTSPEFAMKRLLAAGSGSIYQICPVFRREEQGRLHNPEFSLLEWYRVGFDDHALMRDVARLVGQVLKTRALRPPEWLRYGDAFAHLLGVDIHAATARELSAVAARHGLLLQAPSAHAPLWRDLLLSHLIEPGLGQNGLTFLYDFPADAAALARIRPGSPPLAARFELYLDGVELANGYYEEQDAAVLRARFAAELTERAQRGLASVPLDEYFLAAMDAGLPECSGVALGLDRLLMLATGAGAIREVLAFPNDRT